MNDWDFDTCFAVTDAHIHAALEPAASLLDPSPRERVWSLVDRMVAVARPRTGVPKILLVLARAATSDWIEGVLEVRVRPEGDGTLLEVLVDDGLSVTRVRPPMHLAAPYDELAKAVDLRPQMIAPLTLTGAVDGGFVLRAVPEDVELEEVVDLEDDATPQVPPVEIAKARPTQKPPARASKPPAKPRASTKPPPKRSTKPPPKRSTKPPPRSKRPPPPIIPRAPAAPKLNELPRRAPSDVTATVRRAVDPKLVGDSDARPRRPVTGVTATVKVDAVHIPREARPDARKPPPPPLRSRTAPLPNVPRDDEE